MNASYPSTGTNSYLSSLLPAFLTRFPDSDSDKPTEAHSVHSWYKVATIAMVGEQAITQVGLTQFSQPCRLLQGQIPPRRDAPLLIG